MKIIIFTQEDPFFVIIFFREFFAKFKKMNEIECVVIGDTMGKKNKIKLFKQMVALYGLHGVTILVIQYSYLKTADYFYRLFKLGAPKFISTLCTQKKIEVIFAKDVNSNDFIENMKSMKPDLFVSVAFPFIFRDNILKVPKLGSINIHNSLLPKYRGMLPSFWQLYNAEKYAGITIHEINKKIDEGKIILQDKISINLNETLHSLIKKTKKRGADYIIQAIEMYRKNDVKYTENNAKNGSYYTFPNKEDAKLFRNAGKKIFGTSSN